MDDLISRAEVMKHMHFHINEDSKTEGYVRTEDILSIPAVERKGKWIHYDEGDFDYDYKCSNCGYTVWDNSDFCPNCGVDMRGEEDA